MAGLDLAHLAHGTGRDSADRRADDWWHGVIDRCSPLIVILRIYGGHQGGGAMSENRAGRAGQ